MNEFTAFVMIVVGAIVLAYGPRLVILGAAVGALLGFAILRYLPLGFLGGWGILIPLAIAVVFAFGGGLMRGMIRLFMIALGAVAGIAIVLTVLQLVGTGNLFVDLILAFGGAVIGAILISRLRDWAVYVMSGLVGALLIIRGLQVFIPGFEGIFALLVGVALAAVGIAFQSGYLGMKKQRVQ